VRGLEEEGSGGEDTLGQVDESKCSAPQNVVPSIPYQHMPHSKDVNWQMDYFIEILEDQ